MNLKAIWSVIKRGFSWTLLKETYKEWSQDKAARLAAALSYYTATAMAPLIIGVLAITGVIMSREQAQSQLVAQVRQYVGAQGAEIVETIVANADQPELARLAGILSLLVLLWSASNIFTQLQDSLDTIWGVELRPDLPWLRKLQHRLLPLLTVLAVGLLLILATVASAGLSAAGALVADLLPGGSLLWQIINILISLLVITLVFGLAFKVLPDVDIAWRDVWPGAALTALLFVVGQFILSWYLGRQSGASLYGAAGSLIVLLLWLYYSAQIFLLGAEYTQVYATRYGEGVRPSKDAVGKEESAARKPAAQAAKPPVAKGRPSGAPAAAFALAPAAGELSLGSLVVGALRDLGALFRQEIELARAEVREMVTQLARGVALSAGGGMAIYAGLLFLLFAIALLLQQLMPFWLAVGLVGILVLIEGWILMVWARNRISKLQLLPKQTMATIGQDVEAVKSHLTS